MKRRKKNQFIAFQLHNKWGVLDRKTGELVERVEKVERYPEAWARNRADKLNKD